MENVGQFDIDIDDQNDSSWAQLDDEQQMLENDPGYAQFLLSIASQGV